jgi:hypothetical protein
VSDMPADHVVQVVPTWEQACGISNFADLLGAAMNRQGIAVRFERELGPYEGLVFLHYHPELFGVADVARWVRNARGPTVLVSHEGGARLLEVPFAGHVRLADRPGRPTPAGTPVLDLGHPAWTPGSLLPRCVIRDAVRLPRRDMIIGSSGFIKRDREFPRILAALLPVARARRWFVYLPTSRWWLPSPDVELALNSLRRDFDDVFRFETAFRSAADLNRRLQACDLLWTWTSTPSVDYVSGVVADQYASGTRMVVSRRHPHDAVLSLPNVFPAPDEFDGFLRRLLHVAVASDDDRAEDGVPRHDPTAFSWTAAESRIVDFLHQVRAVHRSV